MTVAPSAFSSTASSRSARWMSTLSARSLSKAMQAVRPRQPIARSSGSSSFATFFPFRGTLKPSTPLMPTARYPVCMSMSAPIGLSAM
jgi:hypothetical protein